MNKPDLLLLHGAAGAASQFEPLLPLLAGKYQLHLLDFEGHGNSPPRERPFRAEHFAENVVEYLVSRAISPVNIFGYSMGGYVAMYLAKTRPELVKGVATLGTKFHWDAEVAVREAKLLDAGKIEQKVPHFARALEARHTASDWKAVLSKTVEMMAALGEHNVLTLEGYGKIEQRARIGVGDRDTMVSVEESAAVYRALPNGEIEVFPGTPHPLEKVLLSRLARSLMEFFG